MRSKVKILMRQPVDTNELEEIDRILNVNTSDTTVFSERVSLCMRRFNFSYRSRRIGYSDTV